MTVSKLAAIALITPLLAGCISTLDSKPATDASTGQLYSLPVPILKFTPQGDGTLALEIVYLPDPDNTYSLEAHSYLGAHTLEAKVKEGLLESVTFDTDSTAVAEQAINSYAEIEAKKVEAQLKAEETAAAATKEKAKENAAAAKAIEDAKAAVALATAKRDALIEFEADDEAILAAKVAVVEAQHKHNALVEQAEARAASGAMNAVAGGGAPQAAGPMFYRMAPGAGGKVNLIADQPQILGDAWQPPKPPAPTADLVLSTVPPLVVRPSRNGLQMKIRASKGFDSVEGFKLTPRTAGVTVRPARIEKAVESGETFIYAVFDDQQAKGLYDLTIRVRLKAGDQPIALNTQTVDIRGPAPQ